MGTVLLIKRVYPHFSRRSKKKPASPEREAGLRIDLSRVLEHELQSEPDRDCVLERILLHPAWFFDITPAWIRKLPGSCEVLILCNIHLIHRAILENPVSGFVICKIVDIEIELDPVPIADLHVVFGIQIDIPDERSPLKHDIAVVIHVIAFAVGINKRTENIPGF